MSNPKGNQYFCKECKKTLTRHSNDDEVTSFCVKSGKTVQLQRVK